MTNKTTKQAGTTAEAASSATPAGSPHSAFFPQDNFLHNVYRDVNNNISDLVTNPSSPGAAPFYINLSQAATSNGYLVPGTAGDPFAMPFVGIQFHVLYRDVNNEISDILYDADRQGWMYQNLSQLAMLAGYTPAPAAGNPIMVTYGTKKHCFYTDINNHISDIFYDTENGDWSYADLSALTNAPDAVPGDPSAIVFQEQLHVFYLDNNNPHGLSDICYNVNVTGWEYQNISSEAGYAYAFGFPGAVVTAENTMNVFTMNGQHQPCVFTSPDGINWSETDMNSGTTTSIQNVPCGIVDAQGITHCIFQTGINDNNLGNYSYSPQYGWMFSNLTQVAPGSELISGSPSATLNGNYFQVAYLYTQGTNPLRPDDPTAIWIVYTTDMTNWTAQQISAN